MGAQSKSKSVLGLLCLTMALSLASVSQAQFQAGSDYRKAGRYNRDDDDDVSAVDKLNSSSSWWDFMAAQQQDFFANANAGGFARLKDQWDQVYGLMTKDPNRKRQNNRQHSKRQEMSSTQEDDSTPMQIYKREKMSAERARLEEILENKTPVRDIPTSNKLFELWLEKQGDRPGVRQDDKYDLIPHKTLYLQVDDNLASEEDMQINFNRTARVLKSSINGDEAVINRLEEPYPTECYNQGKLASQTQKYYMCQALKAAASSENGQSNGDNEAFRVTSETYDMLVQDYTDQYSCYTQNVEKNVCVCPQGSVDSECNTDLYTRCYINITEPAFYKGCENEFEDSFYYLYSVPGFSPCFWQNFSSSIDVTFELNCQLIETNGLVSKTQGQSVGYPYRDVVKAPSLDGETQGSVDPEKGLGATILASVNFDFRDMKYLSHKQPFSVQLDVNQQGKTEGTVPIDFSVLQESDSRGESRYIVGGRTYFEASVFQDDDLVNSFTFRGFFDEEGYEEPKSTLNKLKSSGWLWVIIGSCIALVILAIVLFCYCKKKKEEEKQAKKHKHD